MTRTLTRANFHRSEFIRVLADLSLIEEVEAGNAFAEQLGAWLNLNDAIALCALLNGSTPTLATSGRPVARVNLDQEFARIRAGLLQSMDRPSALRSGGSPSSFPMPKPGARPETASDYGPYRRYYLARQRELDDSVRTLRARARDQLASVSPSLRKLAALDATFDLILGDRESKLFATTPLLLAKRFTQLFTAHQQRVTESGQEDNPSRWMSTGAWLERFCQELHAVLLAELDLRLQPTRGLIEAFNNEMTRQQ